MKTVKIVLGILIVITVAFFCTGLVVKENKYTCEITINKPVAETFQLFSDQSLVKEWIPEITSIESIDMKPGMVGSEYRVMMDNEGIVLSKKEKILAYVKDEKVTYYYDAEAVFKTDDFSFSSNGQTTTITLESAYSGKSYLLSCVFPYFKGTFKDVDVENLANFKEFAEKQ